MQPRALPIDLPLDEIRAFCERHPIRRLALFGSVLRDDFGPDSDIDMLVEFDDSVPVSLFAMGRMQFELTHMLGREVDFKTAGFLSRYFREDVVRDAITVYQR
jgi:predicted nucleotidyltransferase